MTPPLSLLTQPLPLGQVTEMGRTLEMLVAAVPQAARPAWASDGSTFGMLWEPEKGDLAMRAVAQRADEYAAQLKVAIIEVARVIAPQDKNHEAVYVRTEIPA